MSAFEFELRDQLVPADDFSDVVWYDVDGKVAQVAPAVPPLPPLPPRGSRVVDPFRNLGERFAVWFSKKNLDAETLAVADAYGHGKFDTVKELRAHLKAHNYRQIPPFDKLVDPEPVYYTEAIRRDNAAKTDYTLSFSDGKTSGMRKQPPKGKSQLTKAKLDNTKAGRSATLDTKRGKNLTA